MDINSFKEVAKQFLRDIAPGGSLNSEWTPERTGIVKDLALSATPVIGDFLSLRDAVSDVRAGDYKGAALNAVGLLPFVPGTTKILKEMPGGLKLLDHQSVQNPLTQVKEIDRTKYKLFPDHMEFEDRVPISAIRSDQPKLNQDTLQYLEKSGARRDTLSGKFPEVLEVGDGTYYLLDGNHRIVDALRKGESSVDVNVSGFIKP